MGPGPVRILRATDVQQRSRNGWLTDWSRMLIGHPDDVTVTSLPSDIYLRQEGNVFAGFCLSVCVLAR